MIENIDWNNIRPINGSQKEGFEELVCQLARNEKFENAIAFIRKGTPDAGVECFWKQEDESEIAWQAKFFNSPLTNGQWSEIDKSVKTALEKHPNLKQYNISIPQNRADARLDGKQSFLEKWNSRVLKWEKMAQEKGMRVLFEYEGASELIEKLSQPINNGKLFFWFNRSEFTDGWFKLQNEEKIVDLGARYSPDLNVDLDVKYIFEGLYFNQNFKEKTSKGLRNIEKKYNAFLCVLDEFKLGELKTEFESLLDDYLKRVREINIFDSANYSNLVSAVNYIYLMTASTFQKNEYLDLDEASRKKIKEELDKLSDELHNFKSSFNHFDSNLAETPFLIIEGEAGRGKSHLVADVISEKRRQNQFSVLLLGQQFVNGEVWEQILKELHINCSRDEFLGALNSKGEQSDSRVIIYIDAINEGEGKLLWKDRLIGIIKEIKKYKYLGLVLTIRSSYKDLVLPENINAEVRSFTHYGFGGKTKDAVKKFFEHYKIQEPPIPLLNPEFSNPLFLKLYCKGLHDNNIFKIPEGYAGITIVFEYVIKAANKIISERLDYDFKSFNLVSKSIEILVKNILESPSSTLKKETAYNLLTTEFSLHVNNSRKILSELINENILNENVSYNHETEKYDSEIIYFSYERFGDHLIINSILEKEKLSITQNKKIIKESDLYKYIKDERSIMQNQGLIEAMSIQIPEKTNFELYELIEKNKIYSIGEAFLESLVWRKVDTITEKVLKYIDDYILRVNGLFDLFLEKLIQLSIKKEHFFNARFLNDYLFDIELNKRDAFWTVNINDMFFDDSISNILINWVKESNTIKLLDEETKKLLSLILSWFLSSTNRALRDNSTKALVKLFENDLHLLEKLIIQFQGLNDMYIIERLYAVAYGAVLRTKNDEQVKNFSGFIYSQIFENKNPIEHLLVRDYTRGIIEYSIYKGLQDYKPESFNPPYKSEFPDIPSIIEINNYKSSSNENEGRGARERLFSLIMGGSDFARYEIGTNHQSDYSQLTIKSKVDFEKFEQSLSKNNKKILKEIEDNMALLLSPRIDEQKSKDYLERIPYFLQTLFGLDEIKSLEIFEYFKNIKLLKSYGKGRFDLSILQRLIVKDVFDVSFWNDKLFDEYDFRKLHYFSRHEPKEISEAIGMKYLWISYYKWLAVIFDNHLIDDISFNDRFGLYKGAWNPFKRDIDPTILISTSYNDDFDKRSGSWWIPDADIDFGKIENGESWSLNDIQTPNPKDIVQINYEGVEWLNINSYPSWRKDTEGKSHHDIWFHIKSYIIKSENKDTIIKTLKNKSFFNRAIPQERTPYEVYSRECYWSSAYNECVGFDDWKPLHSKVNDKRVIGAVTAFDYMWQEDKDYSKEDNLRILRPTKIIFDLMNLEFKDAEHKFYCKETGELIVLNPTIEYQQGKESLLIKKEPFLKKLKENGLDIIWLVLGAKEVIVSNKIIYEGQTNSVFYFDDKNELNGEFKFIKPQWD